MSEEESRLPIKPPLEFARIEVYVERRTNGRAVGRDVVTKVIEEIRSVTEAAIGRSRLEGSRAQLAAADTAVDEICERLDPCVRSVEVTIRGSSRAAQGRTEWLSWKRTVMVNG